MVKTRMPSIKNVSGYLARVKHFWRGDEALREGIDVRLQVWEGGAWTIHTGDSQYDQDHRGFWGCGTIGSDTNCRDLARQLVDEAAEHAAQCE